MCRVNFKALLSLTERQIHRLSIPCKEMPAVEGSNRRPKLARVKSRSRYSTHTGLGRLRAVGREKWIRAMAAKRDLRAKRHPHSLCNPLICRASL
jgi:hypothetical protein